MSSANVEAVYVVIGGGIAGVSCVEGISLLDEDASIILVSATPYVKAVTHINPLTKLVAEYTVEEKSSEYMSSRYPSLRVIIDSVTKIDAANHTIVTSTDQIIKYQKLCVCMGASPKLIDTESEFVLGLRDIDSAVVLQRKLEKAKRVVIIGNGGIATEVVHELHGIDVVWIIKDKHISATFIDAGAAEFFQESLKKKDEKSSAIVKTMKYTVDRSGESKLTGAALGPSWHDKIDLICKLNSSSKITIEYEAEVDSIESKDLSSEKAENWPVYVNLNNGKTYGCDFILSATGVVPNSDAISIENDNFKLAADNGIEVDSQMRTSITDIYAAGDVCTAAWTQAQHWLQMRLWTQARQMGSYAAQCMVGAVHQENVMLDFCFELFTHVTRFFGYKVILLGLFNAQKLDNNYELLLRITKGAEYVKLVVSEGRVQGAILVGETDLEEMCENLILNQIDISAFGEELLNPNIDIEDYFD